jgi:hypothetical protein
LRFSFNNKNGEVMDDTITRITISALGIICCVSVCGIILLAALNREPPTVLSSVAMASGGALVGILVPVKTQSSTKDNGQK